MAQSGAGAELTKIAESAQCVFAANRFYIAKKDLKPENVKESDLKKALAHCDVDDPKIITNIFKKLDSTWFVSLCLTANKLYSLFGRTGKKFKFHRGSSWVAAFESQYKVWNAESDNAFSNLNKYTPADIWMVNPKYEDFDWSTLPNFPSVNKFLFEGLENKEVIGVSLKKTSTAQHKVYNTPGSQKYKFKFTGSVLTSGDFFSSKDVYVKYDKGKIQFRSFSSRPTGWQGEIKGAEANLGKVSGGPLNKIIVSTFPRKRADIISISDSDRIASDVSNPKNLSEEFINDFYYYYKGLATGKKLTKAEIATGLRKKEATWIYSKYLGMELLTLFDDLSKAEQDKLITEILLYAMSSSPLSAPFVKIG